MGFFSNFPYTNFHEMNLDWVIGEFIKLKKYVEQYTAVNKVEYGGIWTITKNYPQWTIVSNGDSTYMSNKPVPAGVAIENKEYWLHLADLDPRIGGIIQELNRVEQELNHVKDVTDTAPYFLPFFYNKKMLIIGDSISAEDPPDEYIWVKYLREKLPNTTITNIAENGALFSGASGQARKYALEVDGEFDYIFVLAGVNDAYHQATLGTITLSNVDYNNFAGSLGYFAHQVNEKNPSAIVFFMSPIKNRYNQNNTVFVDVYRSYIYHACVMFGWHFIDGNSVPLLSPALPGNSRRWLKDGLHPNRAFSPYLGDFIAESMFKGGSAGITSTNSRMDLSALSDVGGSLYADFNTHGQCVVTFNSPNFSVTAGDPVHVSHSLPAWCYTEYRSAGRAFTGNTAHECWISGSDFYIIPSTTTSGALYAEVSLPITNISIHLGGQI